MDEKQQIFRRGRDIFSINGDTASEIKEQDFLKNYAPNAANIEDLGQRQDLFDQYFMSTPTSIVDDVTGTQDSQGATNVDNDVADLQTYADDVKKEVKGEDKPEDVNSTLRKQVEDLMANSNTSLEDSMKTIMQQLGIEPPDESEEEERIREAGILAGERFDPLIDKAEEARRLGMPRAEVRAGRRGGFENTQFAGLGALQRTEGRTFVGAGGQLETIKSAYDKNISDLEKAKANAILAAERAEKEAIRTGKKADLDTAKEFYQLAQQANDTAITRAANLVNIMAGLQNMEQSAAMAPLTLAKSELDILSGIPSGTTMTLGGNEYVGIGASEVDPFFSGSDIVDLMQTLGEGETRVVIDPNTNKEIEITGLASPDANTKVIQTTNDAGEVTLTSYSIGPDGKPVVSGQASGGKIGKTKTQAANVSLSLNEKQSSGLREAIDALEAKGRTPEGKYSTDEVLTQYRLFSVENPGKQDIFLQVVKPDVNTEDAAIQQLFSDDIDAGGGSIEVTNPSGATIKINK